MIGNYVLRRPKHSTIEVVAPKEEEDRFDQTLKPLHHSTPGTAFRKTKFCVSDLLERPEATTLLWEPQTSHSESCPHKTFLSSARI
jgi:hypothetical protein